MTREEFIKKSLIMGMGLPFLSSILSSCGEDELAFPEFETDFTGDVIIVGAGAAGLAAGYLLERHNINFQIIEAAADYGGRVKRANSFVDFPIDVGAEWIHASPSILADLLNNPQLDASIDFVVYNPQTFGAAPNGNLVSRNFASNFYSEHKFKSTTWYGFFEQYMVPSFASKIVHNQPITEIDYTSNRVTLTSSDNTTYEADKVIVTTPIKVLQNEAITFVPALSSEKSNAINSIFMGDGLKVFIEFSEKFYPDLFFTGGLFSSLAGDDKIFYDAAFRKDSNSHVLGLFTINSPASTYTSLSSDQAIIDKILEELDELFDNQASKYYMQHIVQNWSNEPYIGGSYSTDFDNDQENTVNTIKEPIDNKIYFAGEALSIDNQATVHGACESGYEAVKRILD